VIVELSADEGIVQPDLAVLLGDGEVGVIGQVLIDEDGEGVALRGHRRVAIERDVAAIVRGGLEHDRPPASAPGLQIDHIAHVGRQRTVEEDMGAQQADFFAIGDHDHDVAGGLPVGLERPDDFQRRGHPGGVVRRAGGAGYAVVVGHDRQGWGRAVAAGQDADHILHRPAADQRTVGLNGRPALDLRLQAKRLHPAHQDIADFGVGGGAERMGNRSHGLNVGEGASGGEVRRRRIGGRRPGRDTAGIEDGEAGD